jgi:hypothetical protein
MPIRFRTVKKMKARALLTPQLINSCAASILELIILLWYTYIIGAAYFWSIRSDQKGKLESRNTLIKFPVLREFAQKTSRRAAHVICGAQARFILAGG